jgi:ABC-2 type transport system ATP-binding protein
VPRAEREARADSLLSEMGLLERKNDKPDRYSGGMNQRLMIARALMHSPDVLFLDEPTNNLDPQSRLFLWERIRALNAQGLTILLTTHDISEADQLCQRVAIMDHGKILVNDSPEALKKIIPGGTALEVRIRIPDAVAAGAPPSASLGDRIDQADATARLRASLREIPGVTEVVEANEVGDNSLAAKPPTEEAKPAGKPERGRGRSGGGGGGSWSGGGAGSWGGASSNQANDGEEGTILFRLYADDTAGLVTGVSQVLAEAGAEVRDLHLKKPSLEDVFIYLTGRNLR